VRLLAAAALTIVGGVVWAQWPRQVLPAGTRADRVVVRKSARTLELYRGSELLRTYTIALGPTPQGHKQQEGDGRTPEGRYVLDYRNPGSSFHKSLHVSYPSAADTASARGRGVSPGGMIMVHGIAHLMKTYGIDGSRFVALEPERHRPETDARNLEAGAAESNVLHRTIMPP